MQRTSVPRLSMTPAKPRPHVRWEAHVHVSGQGPAAKLKEHDGRRHRAAPRCRSPEPEDCGRRRSGEPLVIGISGASRSGKSTLAKNLTAALDGASMCQDRFYSHRVQFSPSTWENSDALNHAACRANLQRLIDRASAAPPLPDGRRRCVILEGFRAFYDAETVAKLDVLLWLEVDKDVCRARRMATKPMAEEEFECHLWPRHVEYKQACFAGVLEVAKAAGKGFVLDGSLKPKVVKKQALQAIWVMSGLSMDGVAPEDATPHVGSTISTATDMPVAVPDSAVRSKAETALNDVAAADHQMGKLPLRRPSSSTAVPRQEVPKVPMADVIFDCLSMELLENIFLRNHIRPVDICNCVCACTSLRDALTSLPLIWSVSLQHEWGASERGVHTEASGSEPGHLYRMLCASMSVHHAYLRQLPSPHPSNEQVGNFVGRVAGAHSWYKHLSLDRSTRFEFVLDATAGMRACRDGKYIPYTEDDGTRFHYTWLPTVEYKKRFGHLDFTYKFDPQAVDSAHLPDPGRTSVTGRPLKLPERVARLCDGSVAVSVPRSRRGCVFLSSAVHRNTGVCVERAYSGAYERWKCTKLKAGLTKADRRGLSALPIGTSDRHYRKGAFFPPEVEKDFEHLLRYEQWRDQVTHPSSLLKKEEVLAQRKVKVERLLEQTLAHPSLRKLRTVVTALLTEVAFKDMWSQLEDDFGDFRRRNGAIGVKLVVLSEKFRERLDMADALVDMLEHCGCAGLVQREVVHAQVVNETLCGGFDRLLLQYEEAMKRPGPLSKIEGSAEPPAR